MAIQRWVQTSTKSASGNPQLLGKNLIAFVRANYTRVIAIVVEKKSNNNNLFTSEKLAFLGQLSLWRVASLPNKYQVIFLNYFSIIKCSNTIIYVGYLKQSQSTMYFMAA